MQSDASAPTLKELGAARADFDRWEHYSDHPGFIVKAGGQEAYDAELGRRFQRVTALESRSN